MFGQSGNTSFGFISFAQNSPFDQSAFGKPISIMCFGTTSVPVFGSKNQSLFSVKSTSTTTGRLFGNTTATSGFGQSATTSSSSIEVFGTTGVNTSLFGTQQNANTNLFGTNSTTSAFEQANTSTRFGGFG